MPTLRVIILWHQHQPFYKDLVTGEYRLPWVRLHALKDYYGMVKLLDEFPNVHQNFNLVPSLITQIQDYVAGTAHDPFLDVAAKPAKDLTADERRFSLQYLFQANAVNMIGRYPRYRELWERFRSSGESPDRAEKFFQPQDFTDLQVLSQIAWLDEFFLQEPEIAALIQKTRNYSLDDQRFVIAREGELIAKVLPAHADAAQRGAIEISTSAFYHPILPLICDTNQGAVSTPGLPLPQNRFRHPEDAREQLQRGLDLHEKVFGIRPKGVWPSEGSVSEEVLSIAHSLGVNWMATDEGVLGRTRGMTFSRDGGGRLPREAAENLYTIHRYEKGQTQMHLVFRDHTISEAISRHKNFASLTSLFPGSWINANFNVWIGAPEDNRSWDYLHHAREFYSQSAARASEAQRKLAFEEILIAEGSDWNWWYGPEHHSANDREFDELYRKHLSNVYQALGSRPPDYLAQPIIGGMARPSFVPQTAYIHPRITGDTVRYFEWIGAAVYTADRRAGAMHGKQFLMDSVYAGIDESNVYGRLDFIGGRIPEMDFELVVNLESWAADAQRPRRTVRLHNVITSRKIAVWKVSAPEEEGHLASSDSPSTEATTALARNFEFKLPLAWLLATPVGLSNHNIAARVSSPVAIRLRLRFSIWQNGLPMDALPVEGWMELQLLSEENLMALGR